MTKPSYDTSYLDDFDPSDFDSLRSSIYMMLMHHIVTRNNANYQSMPGGYGFIRTPGPGWSNLVGNSQKIYNNLPGGSPQPNMSSGFFNQNQ